MSLQTRITALVQAIGADIKALYSGKVGTSDARLADAREWTATTVTQTEAEGGTATTRRAWTAQRVFQAIAAWWAASAMKTKLDGIAAGATANATDAQLRDRATHTGTQAISTVTGLQTELDGKINTTERGVSGGIPTLDLFARIPASQLPSYVDDVLEYAALANFPATGEGGKIYIAINQGTAANPTRQYRWTGSVYAEINPSPGTTDALTEGSTNLYFNESRVRNTVLTGLSLASSAAVAATDSVLAAFGKIQARLNMLGTAANANVQASAADVTTGVVALVGGLGGVNDSAYRYFRVDSGVTTSGDCNALQGAGVYNGILASGGGVANAPDFGSGNYFYLQNYVRIAGAAMTQIAWPYATPTNAGDLAWRGLNGTTWAPWVKAWHTGNFNPATKQDKPTIITTATSRTLALTDAWNYVRPGTTSAITLTVPTSASVAFEIGTQITVRAAGNITLAFASGVVLNPPALGTLNMTARMTVTLKKVGTNEWDVVGQTVAA